MEGSWRDRQPPPVSLHPSRTGNCVIHRGLKAPPAATGLFRGYCGHLTHHPSPLQPLKRQINPSPCQRKIRLRGLSKGTGQLVSESRCSGAHVQHWGLLFPYKPTLPSPPWRPRALTLSIAPVRGLGREFADIILQEELVARDPLHRFQHVVLQRQVSTDLPLLGRDSRHRERNCDQGSSHRLLFARSQEILGALCDSPALPLPGYQQ